MSHTTGRFDAPATTTGNGVAGSPSACIPNTAPTGTTTEFDEGIDLDKIKLNGGAASCSTLRDSLRSGASEVHSPRNAGRGRYATLAEKAGHRF